jgi:N-acetylglucosaminyl-diphospho-decaprenol L-rhamnosyltransferase
VSTETHLTISIVSHRQAALVVDLLRDIQKYCDQHVEILLTINVEETLPFALSDFSIPIKLIQNSSPQGFGENHNTAFKQSNSEFFCVLNPDIRLTSNPFFVLIEKLKNSSIGVVSPLIKDANGLAQDSARKFPTPWKILKRILLKKREADYLIKQAVNVDWVAGMFMLFRSAVFKQLNGFDERFFLYCEDTDLCARLHALNYQVIIDPAVSVIHNARRDSHRNFRYLRWHISSLLRFFGKRYFKNF